MELYLRKRHGKIVHIADSIFRSNYYFICTPKHSDFVRIVKENFKFDVEDHNSAEGECLFVETEDNNICILWTSSMKPHIVAHEVFHAVAELFRMMRIPLTEDTEEVYALYQQYLLGACLCPERKKKKNQT